MASNIAAHKWLTKHSYEADKYSGKWIAVVEGEILGASSSLKALMNTAKVKAANRPLFTKIPNEEEAFSLL